jgi:hypothetical protein
LWSRSPGFDARPPDERAAVTRLDLAEVRF